MCSIGYNQVFESNLTFGDGVVLRSTAADSITECADFCEEDADCIAFQHDSTKSCTTFGAVSPLAIQGSNQVVSCARGVRGVGTVSVTC